MRKACRVLAITGLFLVPASPSHADWFFTPFVGRTFNGATTLIELEPGASEEAHWNFGGAVTLLGDSPIGIEGYFVRTPGFFESSATPCNISTCIRGSRTYAWMGNVVLATPGQWNRYGLRPFVSGGVGLLHASRDVSPDPLPVDLNLLGMNVGGGAVGFLSERVGVRFDLRYFRKIHGPDESELEVPISFGPIRLRYWTASMGVVFKY